MRTSNASLADPFDSSPVPFPEHSLQVEWKQEHARRPVHDLSPPGSWKYLKQKGHRLGLAAAVIISVAFHGALLLGFNFKRSEEAKPTEEPFSLTLIKLPQIPDDPEESLEDLEKGSDVAEGVDVPRQADIPASVILDTMITQRFDPSTLQPNLNLNGTKLLTIPNNIRPGGAGGHGLKEIFNIADLDRQPTPIFQAPPNIPPALRQAGERVEMMIEFIINNKGDVVDVRILETTNYKFNDVAASCVLKWRFKPGMKKGRSVASRVHQPMIITVTASGD